MHNQQPCPGPQLHAEPSLPVRGTMNRDWRFIYSVSSDLDLACKEINYDDSNWPAIALPHTWSTYETTGELHPFMKHPSETDDEFWWYGWGWYRKRFVVDQVHRDRKLFLEFDGVQKYCQVWLNGICVGEHKGGFTSFSLDVTEFVTFDQENVLAVAVSNRRNDMFGGIPPMTAGNWNVYGGIYRDVRLVIKNRVHIPFQGSAEYDGGTFITTDHVSEESADVRIRTFVKNDGHRAERCTLKSTIIDPTGQTAAEMSSVMEIAPGQCIVFDQEKRLENVKLWSPDHPHLYRVVTDVFINGERADGDESPLGFRWFHWDYDEKRLYLNGKRIHLHGTNRHQEYPWLGDAVPKWIHEADLYDIKYKLGHNFLRTCHYTQDKFVYDWCDRHGLLVCEEVPNIKNIAFGEAEQERQVREMIRRDRNHPCIIMWSMGNETNHAADARWAREEDPTRIIHFRHVTGRGMEEPHNHHQMDMENVLRCTIRGWHNADVKPLEPLNGQHTGHEKWQHDMALIEGASQRGRIDTNGGMWVYADHGADREYVNSPLKHVNPKGWVDAYRIPKLMYYLWQANWAPEPMVFIHPYEWSRPYLGQARDLVVNSNCDTVELFVNGMSLGVRTPCAANDFTVIYPHVTIVPGTVAAVGKKGEITVEHRVSMAGYPAAVVLEASHDEIPADRSGIALIRVHIVDEHGVHVYGAHPTLHFEVAGPGRLVGPSAYESDIDKSEAMEGCMYIDLPVAFPIRSTNEPGTIRISVTAEGLPPATIDIRSILPQTGEPKGIYQPREADPIIPQIVLKAHHPTDEQGERYRLAGDVLSEVQDDIHLGMRDAASYRTLIDAFIRKDNTVPLDGGAEAYERLLDHMVAQLMKDHGNLVADDYNFNIRLYNKWYKLADYIRRSDIDEPDKKTQVDHYIERIIVKGQEVDLQEEIDQLMK